MAKKNNVKPTTHPKSIKDLQDLKSRRPATGDRPNEQKAATQNKDKPEGSPPTMKQ